MSEENVEIVRRYYAAWNARGLDAAGAFWSDDFEWHDAPGMPDGNVFRGAEAAAAHFRDLNEVVGTMEVHLERVLPTGDEVFLLLHVHLAAPRGELALDSSIFETVRIEEGKIPAFACSSMNRQPSKLPG